MSAINVTAQNNSGGFTGGGMHLRNTGHLFPGQPLRGLLIRNNTCAGAGGVVVLGGERRLRLDQPQLARAAHLHCHWDQQNQR